MKTMELRTADGREVARSVHMACSFTSRWSGRFRRVPGGERDRVLLVPCRSVHTIGMHFAIDVVFLTRRMKIVGLAAAVPPWRFKLAPAGTRWILQLGAGQIAAAGLTVGTHVVVESEAEEPPCTPTIAESPAPARTTCVPRQQDGAQRSACERLPIQFSLRLPLERRCAAACHAKRERR
jgi:uncharacterized protein